jgi:hypothetical protein
MLKKIYGPQESLSNRTEWLLDYLMKHTQLLILHSLKQQNCCEWRFGKGTELIQFILFWFFPEYLLADAGKDHVTLQIGQLPSGTFHIWTRRTHHATTTSTRRCKQPYEGVLKSFRTESIAKYTLTKINTHSEATQNVMAAKLTRLNHNGT